MSLVTLVVEHHEDLEVDLLRQQIDLLDFWRGKLTPRRLRVLIGHLPPGSLTLMHADPESVYANAWTATDYLLANVYDLLAAVHLKDAKPLRRPEEMWKAKLQAERAAEFLAAQAERNRMRDRAGG